MIHDTVSTESVQGPTVIPPNERVLDLIEKILDQQGRILDTYTQLIESLSYPRFIARPLEYLADPDMGHST